MHFYLHFRFLLSDPIFKQIDKNNIAGFYIDDQLKNIWLQITFSDQLAKNFKINFDLISLLSFLKKTLKFRKWHSFSYNSKKCEGFLLTLESDTSSFDSFKEDLLLIEVITKDMLLPKDVKKSKKEKRFNLEFHYPLSVKLKTALLPKA